MKINDSYWAMRNNRAVQGNIVRVITDVSVAQGPRGYETTTSVCLRFTDGCTQEQYSLRQLFNSKEELLASL